VIIVGLASSLLKKKEQKVTKSLNFSIIAKLYLFFGMQVGRYVIFVYTIVSFLRINSIFLNLL